MIELDGVGVTYHGSATPALSGVDLRIEEGELCLVVGRTGSGKSTLLRTINGLVPHFTGGTLHGRVTVDGRDTATHPPRELADVVGVVGQDPRAGFVTDVVEEELAYGMESLGLAPEVMRRRVEETLDLLGLADLRTRPLDTLSGGERQRVAIGSVLTTHPRVLVLDEPTSALDPPAAEEVLATLHRLVHDLGLTVLLAEHRLERVVPFADRIVHLPGDGAAIEVGSPAEVMATSPIAPPIVELGRLAGWSPLPLTIRDARRHAAGLRRSLAELPVPTRTLMPVTDAPPVLRAARLAVSYGRTVALREVDLSVAAGEIVAVMGRNGAGKSTLLRAWTGLLAPDRGLVTVTGHDPVRLSPAELVRQVALVPQEPADLLYAETVAAECDAADHDADLPSGSCAALLEGLVPGLDPDRHPRDLSEGQRLALVLAIQLVSDPPVVLLDEPTRGLDYAAKRRLVTLLRQLAAEGRAVVLATHDVELVAAVASRTVVLADGEVVVDGPTSEVVVGSPAFAPQIAKVVAPLPWLTVDEVSASLEVAS
ncbi:MAG: ATP-binding cassette domain-containing protein [Nitriliruptor sp.]|nr:MAG: ATP-binding cassette domain-containing protein [Nitriliruptor sp.]